MADPERRIGRRVSGIVLAGGRSTRFGGRLPKQLHKVNGETMVFRTARTALASRLGQILVVAGYHASDVGAAVAGLAVEVVVNPDFASGQSTSVKAGLARLETEAGAAMFIPCDLPNLDSGTIDALIAAYARSGGPIVVPTFEGRRRAPVLIDESLFSAVRSIAGDQGARQLFAAHESEIVEVGFESSQAFEDLDRPGSD